MQHDTKVEKKYADSAKIGGTDKQINLHWDLKTEPS